MCSCRKAYDSSITDAQWAVIEPLLPQTAPALGGRPHVYPRRLIIDDQLCAGQRVRLAAGPADQVTAVYEVARSQDTWVLPPTSR